MEKKIETLASIAGYEEEKKEAVEFINILKNYNKYKNQGAYIPKGLILSGMPGVGKTLLAKAIAGESKVPFYEFEYNEDDSDRMVVKNLKETFRKAKENIPSIVLIDELDEIVPNTNFISDFSRKILKIILTEIDGANSSDGVLIIATKSKNNQLSAPLVRSGRMDKHIHIDIPNISSRKAIFELYLKNKNCATDVSTEMLAQKTNGFTGADIKTLINETLLYSITSNDGVLTMAAFEKVIPTIVFKDITRNNLTENLSPVAYHELGHFVAAYQLREEITSISLEKYGETQGFIQFESGKDFRDVSASKMNDEIIIDLAGMAAEEVFLNDNFMKSWQDIQSAKRKIRSLFLNGALGFKNIDLQNFPGHQQEEFYSLDYAIKESDILEKCYKEAKKVVIDNKQMIQYIYPELCDRKKLSKVRLSELVQEFQKFIVKGEQS